MNLAERLCSLALRVYPRDFREDNREEILGTIADMRDAHESTGPLRQAVSLGYNGNRLRWLRATGGSVGQTLRQGIAWGVLLLIARQAGLGIYELIRPLWGPWTGATLLPHYPDGHSDFSSVEIALLVGWAAVFFLLISGRRRWGLPLLGAVLAGYVTRQVMFSLGYGGPFSWSFTLSFCLPVLLPLLCAYVWPQRGARLSWRFGVVVLIGATALPAVQVALWNAHVGNNYVFHSLVGWAIQVGVCFIAAVFIILVGLSDPRWAMAGTLIAFQPVVREAIQESSKAGFSAVFLFVGLIPIVALFLAFRARRRAIPARD